MTNTEYLFRTCPEALSRAAAANAANAKARATKLYEVEDLLTIGPITITDVGEENMYFTLADGTFGYCKAF